MFALGLDLADQLWQPALHIEAGYQFYAMIALLRRLGRLADLGLLERHPAQHGLAIADDWLD